MPSRGRSLRSWLGVRLHGRAGSTPNQAIRPSVTVRARYARDSSRAGREGEGPVQERALGSRYVLTQVVGRGAMGRIYLAHVVDSDEIVAVKVLRDDLVADDDLVARFLQEARL